MRKPPPLRHLLLESAERGLRHDDRSFSHPKSLIAQADWGITYPKFDVLMRSNTVTRRADSKSASSNVKGLRRDKFHATREQNFDTANYVQNRCVPHR